MSWGFSVNSFEKVLGADVPNAVWFICKGLFSNHRQLHAPIPLARYSNDIKILKKKQVRPFLKDGIFSFQNTLYSQRFHEE
jgi:hypothetical protein